MLSCSVLRAKRSVVFGVLGAKKILDWVKHKTQYTQLNSIFWCFLLIWCNFYRFNLFLVWKYKNICVLCNNQAERGWHHRNMTYNTNYTHKKTCITSSAGKGVISEFSYSLDNCEDTNLTLYGIVTQLVEWQLEALQVVGSIPTDSTKFSYVIHLSMFCYLLRNFDS